MTPSTSDVLLDLYRGAQTNGINEFPSFAIETMARFIEFDMAMFFMMSYDAGGQVVVHHAHLFNEAPPMVDEWLSISRHDQVVMDVMHNPGRAFSYCVPERFKAIAPVWDYALRRRHMNVLGATWPYASGGVKAGLSLRRADGRWHYRQRDKTRLQTLLPHVCEAFRINRAVFSQAVQLSMVDPLGGFCVFDGNGFIVYQDAAFAQLAAVMFASPGNYKIPQRLQAVFCRERQHRLTEGRMTFEATAIANLYFLKVRPVNRLDALTVRELTVARFYGTGLTYKEIGAELTISPSTVRRHIEAIYQKLKVRTKADLAFLLHADAGAALPSADGNARWLKLLSPG